MSKKHFVEDIADNLDRFLACYSRDEYDYHHASAMSQAICWLIDFYLAVNEQPDPEPIYTNPETGEVVDAEARDVSTESCVVSTPSSSSPPPGQRLLAEVRTLLSELSDQRIESYAPDSEEDQTPPSTTSLKSLYNASKQLREMLADTGNPSGEPDPTHPDENGYVESPIDRSSYVSSQDILDHFHFEQIGLGHTSINRLSKDFENNAIRWTRPLTKAGHPNQRGRLIHAADWLVFIKRKAEDSNSSFE